MSKNKNNHKKSDINNSRINENEGFILEQWKTCVDMANSVSQRRDSMNNWFITLNIGLFVTLSMNIDHKSVLGSILVVCLCIIWLGFIKNFKNLNTAKFKIINNLEKHLPTQPFEQEWSFLEKNKKYVKCTTLESCLAILFIVMYLSLCAFSTTKTGGMYVIQYLYQSLLELF